MPQPPTLLLLLLLSTGSALALRLCSFNVRSFGEAKKENKNAMDVIVKVIKRCDIILLMEIKDSNNIICPMLMDRLNGNSRNSRNSRKGTMYNYVISSRLGRNTYKEQYAFLYKEKLLSVKKRYLYHDYQAGDTDVFSREPFVVWFQSPYTVVKDFVIVPLHTTPETSVKEIDELADVYTDMKHRWKAENFIFMGDFNAGCSYVPKKAWKNIRLRTDPGFVWLIGDQEDTTVKESTNCAYDRIVLRGQEIISFVVHRSNRTFDFQKAYGLTKEEALDVSDHFPVEFKLQSSRVFATNKKSISPRKKKTRRS
ncbi:deoxyribonuclease gamma [Acinonyx jubatus]|uniref:Deoxyribonuclease n=1 Tax=Acinonyx jubatus TaxID=32536 RepID=A0A6J1Z416_ACIJB|nr:deoxyribonuclease gamma [Acinonyx jubatus]